MISKDIRFAAAALRDGVDPALTAGWLESLADAVAALERAMVPLAARGPAGGLPDGVADLDAARRRRRRLRLVSDGDAA